MSELEEVKQRLLALGASNNGCVSIEDVKNVVAFIDGLIYEIGVIDEVERIISDLAIYFRKDVDLNEIKKVLREIIENDNTGNSRKS